MAGRDPRSLSEESPHAATVVERISASYANDDQQALAAPIQEALDLMSLQGRLVELDNLSIAMEPIWENRMQRLITVFDTLFFEGEMGPVHFEWDHTLLQRGALGLFTGIAGETTVISVDPRPPRQSANGVRAWCIIGTLLHECVLAVFEKSCADCCENPLEAEHYHDPACYLCVGISGHGPV